MLAHVLLLPPGQTSIDHVVTGVDAPTLPFACTFDVWIDLRVAPDDNYVPAVAIKCRTPEGVDVPVEDTLLNANPEVPVPGGHQVIQARFPLELVFHQVGPYTLVVTVDDVELGSTPFDVGVSQP